MRRDVKWLFLVLVIVALGTSLLRTPEPDRLPLLTISGVAPGMTEQQVLEAAGEPVSRSDQGGVLEFKFAEATGRNTRVYLRSGVILVLGYNLRRDGEVLLKEGDPGTRVPELLGPPSRTVQRRHDVFDYVYDEHRLKLSVVGGNVQEIGLGDIPRQPAPSATPAGATAQYRLCARHLEVAVEQLRAEYGPDGTAPMQELNALSLRYPCPSAGKPTMSATGTGAPAGVSLKDLTLFCRGDHHAEAGAPEHFPEIHSVRGLTPLPTGE